MAKIYANLINFLSTALSTGFLAFPMKVTITDIAFKKVAIDIIITDIFSNSIFTPLSAYENTHINLYFCLYGYLFHK